MIRKELENEYLEAMESEELYRFLQEVVIRKYMFLMSVKDSDIEEAYYVSKDICYYVVFKKVEYEYHTELELYKIERY